MNWWLTAHTQVAIIDSIKRLEGTANVGIGLTKKKYIYILPAHHEKHGGYPKLHLLFVNKMIFLFSFVEKI